MLRNTEKGQTEVTTSRTWVWTTTVRHICINASELQADLKKKRLLKCCFHSCFNDALPSLPHIIKCPRNHRKTFIINMWIFSKFALKVSTSIEHLIHLDSLDFLFFFSTLLFLEFNDFIKHFFSPRSVYPIRSETLTAPKKGGNKLINDVSLPANDIFTDLTFISFRVDFSFLPSVFFAQSFLI